MINTKSNGADNVGFMLQASFTAATTGMCVWVLTTGKSPEFGATLAGCSVLSALCTFRHIASDLATWIKSPSPPDATNVISPVQPPAPTP